jgi:thioredoxin 1
MTDVIETLTTPEIQPRVVEVTGPVALDLYQESCPPCRTLEPRLERVTGDYQDRLTVYRVDVDRDMEVAESFRVMSLPTVLVFKEGR